MDVEPLPESDPEFKPWLKYVGHSCVVLGVIGAILPIMPGTVFFVAAAYFYARSSRKFYHWIMNHKLIGPHIRNYKAGKISRSGKIISIAMMTVAVLFSIYILKAPLWLTLVLVAVNLAASIYILMKKTA